MQGVDFALFLVQIEFMYFLFVEIELRVFSNFINDFEFFNLNAKNFANIECDDDCGPITAGYHATDLDCFVRSGCEEVIVVLVSGERRERYFFDDFSLSEAKFY